MGSLNLVSGWRGEPPRRAMRGQAVGRRQPAQAPRVEARGSSPVGRSGGRDTAQASLWPGLNGCPVRHSCVGRRRPPSRCKISIRRASRLQPTTIPALSAWRISPGCLNLTVGDFHLQTNSPCINAGNNARRCQRHRPGRQPAHRRRHGGHWRLRIPNTRLDHFLRLAPAIRPAHRRLGGFPRLGRRRHEQLAGMAGRHESHECLVGSSHLITISPCTPSSRVHIKT